jgi:hypothetical protein
LFAGFRGQENQGPVLICKRLEFFNFGSVFSGRPYCGTPRTLQEYRLNAGKFPPDRASIVHIGGSDIFQAEYLKKSKKRNSKKTTGKKWREML